jgi:hypothetical protein
MLSSYSDVFDIEHDRDYPEEILTDLAVPEDQQSDAAGRRIEA